VKLTCAVVIAEDWLHRGRDRSHCQRLLASHLTGEPYIIVIIVHSTNDLMHGLFLLRMPSVFVVSVFLLHSVLASDAQPTVGVC